GTPRFSAVSHVFPLGYAEGERLGSGPMPETADYPGERLGLPQTGLGSIAGIRPRVVAFLIDSVVANIVALLALGGRGPGGLYVLAAFAFEIWIFTAFVGGSVGHLACRLEVLRLDHKPVGPW